MFRCWHHNLQVGNALLKAERSQFLGLGKDFLVLFGELLRRLFACWKMGELHIANSATLRHKMSP